MSLAQDQETISSSLTINVTAQIDAVLAEWGEHQPGGLSNLIPRLLKEAHDREETEDNARWDASFAATSEESLRNFADKIRADYAAGKTRLGGFAKETVALLRFLREDGDEQDQCETFEILKKGLNEAHPDRMLFT